MISRGLAGWWGGWVLVLGGMGLDDFFLLQRPVYYYVMIVTIY